MYIIKKKIVTVDSLSIDYIFNFTVSKMKILVDVTNYIFGLKLRRK